MSWQKATVEDRLKEVKLIIPIDDAVESILDALPGFLRHVTSKTSKKPRRQNE